MSRFTFPEPLEARLAPAVFISAFEVRYLEGDGDRVSVKSTRALFHDDLREFTFVPDGTGEQLQLLSLGAAARGASLRIIADPVGGGPGLAAVGAVEVDADLGTVTVDGALGSINVGDATTTTTALQTLTVDSLGGVSGVPMSSEIRGPAGAVLVAGDVSETSVHVVGNLPRLSIGGSLIGGAADDSGTVRVDGRLTRAEVFGSVIGASGLESGSISAGILVTAIVSGDVIGGAGDGSGQLFGAIVGTVKISGDLVGGSAPENAAARHHGTGMVLGERSIGSVSIAGSLVGGGGQQSGTIISGGPLSQAQIQGNIIGGAGDRSGTLRAGGDLGLIRIHGSVIGGDGSESGSIRAGAVLDQPSGVFFKSIVRLQIDGDLRGGEGSVSGIVEAPRRLGYFKIAGSVLGGAGQTSGFVGATQMPFGFVGGDLVGGLDHSSGQISALDMGVLQIAGDFRGGEAISSGIIGIGETARRIFIGGDVIGGERGTAQIFTGFSLGSLEIGGSLIASDELSNAIISGASVGSVRIHGSVLNTRTTYSSEFPPAFSGAFIVGNIGSFTVDGGIIAAPGDAGATPVTSYALVATGKVGTLQVGGVLEGNASNRIGLAAGALVIQGGGAFGNEPPPTAAGFGSIDIGGSVLFAEINAGTEMSSRLSGGSYVGNPDARIGSIIARGSWTASTITVGTSPGPDGDYGTIDDSEPLDFNHPGVSAARSQLGSVVIVGRVSGSAATDDHFAIQAQRIGFASISGKRVPLTAGLDDFQLEPTTRDVRLRELFA